MRQDLIEKSISELRLCESSLNHAKNQPVFVFLCGGDNQDSKYICRNETERYLHTNPLLSTIVSVKPEILLNHYGFLLRDLDLLELESFIADLSDAVLLYDESPGTVCELGAFAMSDPIRQIMTVAIPEKYKGDASFVINGPVRHIERESASHPLSSVIYLDIECPFSSDELSTYFVQLRDNAKKQNDRRINKDPNNVYLDSMCREFLDLISVFAPLSDGDLTDIYKQYKSFESFSTCSKTFANVPGSIGSKAVIAFLAATGLIDYENGIIEMKGRIPSYFMFNASKASRVAEIRARVLAAKRKRYDRCASVYSR